MTAYWHRLRALPRPLRWLLILAAALIAGLVGWEVVDPLPPGGMDAG